MLLKHLTVEVVYDEIKERSDEKITSDCLEALIGAIFGGYPKLGSVLSLDIGKNI